MSITDYAAGASLIIACISAWISIQNNKLAKLNVQLSNALTLEIQLLQAKKDWDIAIKDGTIAVETALKSNTTILKVTADAINTYKDSAIENYLNLFERLSFFILNKTFNEEHYRIQYRSMLSNTITSLSSHPAFSGSNPIYNKMVELNTRWRNV